MHRLRIIEGQVRGLSKMIDDDRPCLEVLRQLVAAQEALSQVGKLVTRNYLENCVTAAMAMGDAMGPNDSREYSDDIEDCNLVRSDLGVGNTGLGAIQMGCSNDNRPRNWPNWQAQARSRHPGGVNVCFCDGSVHFIANTVTQDVWFYINARDDGVVIKPSTFD